MSKYVTKYEGFLHGGDYNPEQWLDYPGIFEQDLEFMKKAHCNAMSIGIFSWSFFEPEEGVYRFDHFDKIVDGLTENGIKIVLATPSGARPRWMAEKYPEVLRVDKNMRRNLYSRRHNHCYTSPVYREKVAKINRLLAERYSGNDNVILWHISNEYGGECHCDLCQAAFRNWLKRKYDNDLKKLNNEWWSGFWSHTVTDWEQIHSPVSIGEGDEYMTGLYLDWKKFVTYQTTDFMKAEIEAVRAVNPDIPVTANFMRMYDGLDYNYMKNYVDVISWDAYPDWHCADNAFEASTIGFCHDWMRCFKNKPFLLMESTPSNANWKPINKLKRPGMHKLSSLQAVAHGSDSVQYFQWRKGRSGSEKFHGAVIDHNGKAEGRVFEDVTGVGTALEKIQRVAGSRTVSDVALVYDIVNKWALDNASGFCKDDKKYNETCFSHYYEFWKRGINVDVIGSDADIDKYKVLILPMLYSISEETAERIEAYAAKGGTVVATYATGYVNENDLCYMGGFPGGVLKDVFGLVADEIDTLYDTDKNSVLLNGKSYEVGEYCELITSDTAETVATYEDDFYAGMPAVLKNKYKKGTAYYIGTRDRGEMLEAIYGEIIKENNIESYDLPYGVTLQTRENFVFVQNYSDKDLRVTLPGRYTDIERDCDIDGEFELEKYGIRVLEKKGK